MEERFVSQGEIIIDEQALSEVSNGISGYISACREMLEDAIRKLKATSEDWNDEDFNMLVSAMGSFMADVESIETEAKQLTERINNKINAVHELHSIKI